MLGIEQCLRYKQKSLATFSPKPLLNIDLVESKTQPCQDFSNPKNVHGLERFYELKSPSGVLETWTFPDGVLGNTEIIIITQVRISLVFYSMGMQISPRTVYIPISRLFQNFFSDLVFLAETRGLELFKTQNLDKFIQR